MDFDDFQGLATLFSDLVSETPVYDCCFCSSISERKCPFCCLCRNSGRRIGKALCTMVVKSKLQIAHCGHAEFVKMVRLSLRST